MGLSVKKTTFKQRIRKNDMKRRHKVSSELRKRARTGRREFNRFDRIRTAERPLEEMVAEVAQGSAIASREVCYDARQLTDLLLRPAESMKSSNRTATANNNNNSSNSSNSISNDKISLPNIVHIDSNSNSNSNNNKMSQCQLILPTEPLMEDDAMVLSDAVLGKENEQSSNNKLAGEFEKDGTPKAKNEYRHHGQAYVFWERVGLHPYLLQALRAMQFTHPTPVQEEVLPFALGYKTNEKDDDDDKEQENSGDGVYNSNYDTSKKIPTNDKSNSASETAQSNDSSNIKQNSKKNSKKHKRNFAKNGSGEHNTMNKDNKDYIVSAETGSGKTLVFALPILNNLLYSLESAHGSLQINNDNELNSKRSQKGSFVPNKKQEENKSNDLSNDDNFSQHTKRVRLDTGAQVTVRQGAVRESAEQFQRRLMHSLILSPTRELAMQIHVMLKQLTVYCPHITVGCIVGGMAPEKQQRILNRHPHILICTPGRLWELVQENEGCYLGHSISRRLHYLVLDEADKMLQSGRFEELHNLLERIHCEVLPAGFVQEREEGALPAEIDLEAGTWDEATQKFIPLSATMQSKKPNKHEKVNVKQEEEEEEEEEQEQEQEEEEESKEKASKKRLAIANKKQKGNKILKDNATEKNKSKKRVRGDNEAETGTKEKQEDEEKRNNKRNETTDDDEKKELQQRRNGKEISKHAHSEEQQEELEENEEEEEEIVDNKIVKGKRTKKDIPRPIPMPPDPPQHHRVITFVTSATLSLETNYERRDFKAHKSVIRTSNADTMNKVLQQLEIKTSNARIFTLGETAHVVHKINETYLRCPEESKDLYLYYFLRTFRDARTIVFVNAISMLRRLVKLLEVLGIAVAGLHAAMQQRQRLKCIDKFKSGITSVLIATDVASRGLDVTNLKYVIHYQVPRSTDAYIHRCGRTARCGSTGLSLLLVNASEHVSFRKLNESLNRPISVMELFAIQPTVVHQLHAHLRIARQIDKLHKEVDKSRAANQWVKMTSAAAELETDDMYDEDVEEVNREKLKAIKILHKELELLITKFTGSFGGKGAFRTGAQAMGAQLAEQKLKERANRQVLKSKVKNVKKR